MKWYVEVLWLATIVFIYIVVDLFLWNTPKLDYYYSHGFSRLIGFYLIACSFFLVVHFQEKELVILGAVTGFVVTTVIFCTFYILNLNKIINLSSVNALLGSWSMGSCVVITFLSILFNEILIDQFFRKKKLFNSTLLLHDFNNAKTTKKRKNNKRF